MSLEPPVIDDTAEESARLHAFIEQHHNVMVLTGAGISAASGIPTYRDHHGQWQRSDPIQHRQFMDQHYYRQRYWAH